MSEVIAQPKTAVVNQVHKRIRMDLWDIIKFQIMVHANINKIILSEYDVSCLALLAMCGNIELTQFCSEAIKQDIFGSTQSVRNAMAKIEKKGLIIKTGRSKKRISINPNMNVQTEGNILLDYKIVRIDSKEA